MWILDSWDGGNEGRSEHMAGISCLLGKVEQAQVLVSEMGLCPSTIVAVVGGGPVSAHKPD